MARAALGAVVEGGERVEAVWECGGALMASGGDGRARGGWERQAAREAARPRGEEEGALEVEGAPDMWVPHVRERKRGREGGERGGREVGRRLLGRGIGPGRLEWFCFFLLFKSFSN
jgi:hypothetical protein